MQKKVAKGGRNAKNRLVRKELFERQGEWECLPRFGGVMESHRLRMSSF